ncbi:hypothetical protein MJO52_09795 [Microbulbifer variabilis]|uniref:Uncharacterized protein n=1 Tax=Microbulbifer variabilis TaxID=266805 RepID=A0ABY4VNH4_9GAMM|nr:hypothetical protein [Microbulbifer variabilis]USD23409.1 hypothetical protein MJO52_09795 [Microbulbifer variabilis]
MFPKYALVTAAISAAFIAFEAQAKTFKYEIQDITSSNASLQYPGLDLNGADSATLIIDQADPSSPAVITSLDVNFPNASKLSVRNFNSTNGLHRATVGNTWVYRQLNIEVHGVDFQNSSDQNIYIDGFVSEAESFIGANQPGNQGQPLFHVGGRLVDVTPGKVTDIKILTLDGNRLRLSLNDKIAANPNNNHESVIVIDSLWFGNGEAKLYIPIPMANNEAKFSAPYKLNISTTSGPEGDEHFIHVLAKDERGNEFPTAEFPLQHLLEEAYRNHQ